MSFILLGVLNSQVSGAAAGAYDLLETVELTSLASGVTFSGLDSYTDYKHLQVRFTNRSNASSSNDRYLIWRFNNDTGSNYYEGHYLRNVSSTVSSGVWGAGTYIQTYGGVWAADYAGVYGAGVIDILDFSDSNKYTTTRHLIGNYGNFSYTPVIETSSGLWRDTSAITEIDIALLSGGNWQAGTRFSLYGMR